jgi:hypothetical protein
MMSESLADRVNQLDKDGHSADQQENRAADEALQEVRFQETFMNFVTFPTQAVAAAPAKPKNDYSNRDAKIVEDKPHSFETSSGDPARITNRPFQRKTEWD